MRKLSTRRHFLSAAGVTALGSSFRFKAFAQDEEEYFDDADALFYENAEPSVSPTRALADWKQWKDSDPKPNGIWAPNGHTVDNWHLGVSLSDTPFTLTADLLQKTLATSHIQMDRLTQRVLFGIRAATLLNAEAFADGRTFQTAIELAESVPDHFHPHCVLGVWDRDTDKLWAAPGSTVCNIEYLYAQADANNQDKLCNLLPAGVYNYRVGTHRNGAKSRQPGAFRLASSVAVLRNYNETKLGFAPNDNWEFRGPDVGDNIHAAYILRSGRPRFSSAGCQVIPGTVRDNRTRHTGLWRQYRIAAGLLPDPIIKANAEKPQIVSTTEDRTAYSYVLLPARELRLAASAVSVGKKLQVKLRRGSYGDAVKRLQASLDLSVDGDFGFQTQRAVITTQNLLLGKADGVVTPERLALLGLDEGIF